MSFRGESAGAAGSTAGAHQRVDGAARLELTCASDGRTALSDLYQRAPCRVLFPAPETGDPMLAVLLTTSGGLTGGDRTEVAAVVGPQASATVTTQAAEKIYRALATDRDTSVRVEVSVGAGAWAEWLAQETILFDGARLRRTLRAEVASSARLLALESMVFGRTEMGERFESGGLHDSWYVTRDGRPLWIDALRLEGDVGRLRAAPFGLGTCVAYSTLLYVGADAAERLDFARDSVACCGGLGAATAFDGMLIVRAMADRAHDLRLAMAALAAGLRHEAGAWPARLPRVWSC
jgi:urease accessory protein